MHLSQRFFPNQKNTWSWYLDLPYNLYYVGGDVKHYSIRRSVLFIIAIIIEFSMRADVSRVAHNTTFIANCENAKIEQQR